MKSDKKTILRIRAYQLRRDCLRATTAAGSGHPTSCLSAADIMSVLFFSVMRCDIDNYLAPENDRFILSKGHAAPVLYAVWKQLGKLADGELLQLRTFNSPLEGHPTTRFIYAEGATGSLGQGLSLGIGQALAARMDNSPARVFVLLGDGELAEGSVWEAAELAAYYKLTNLIAIVDVNRLGQSGETLVGHDCAVYADRFEAFGWRVLMVDGHDITGLLEAFAQATNSSDPRPCVLVAKTRKGAGLDGDIEDQNGFHGRALSPAELPAYLERLAVGFPDAIDTVLHETAVMQKPQKTGQVHKQYSGKLPRLHEPLVAIDPDKRRAVREVFGQALTALGEQDERVVCLDGDVKNSTFTEKFEEKFPDRFIECFIAEQNMIGVASGLAARGKVPFAATFAAFLTRAHDQIRMAAIGRVPLRLMGSHAGVSIGQDGPSQMGLEDLGMIRSLPDSIIFYPSDPVSTAACVALMDNYTAGISYLRATRMVGPVLYDQSEQFVIGGCKVIKQDLTDQVCIIAAGITLWEALTAYKGLLANGVSVRIIDCYSIKPLPVAMLREAVQACENRVIVVEDNYPEGGLGEAVLTALAGIPIIYRHLAVTKLPRSGTSAELLAFEEIDARAIERAVRALV